MNRNRVVVALGALALTASLPFAAAADKWSKAVWVSDATAVRKFLASDGSMVFSAPGSETTTALAVDGVTPETCAFTASNHLRCYSFDTGANLFDVAVSVPPPGPGDSHHTVLGIDGVDGRILIGVDKNEIAYTAAGALVSSTTRPSALVGFGSDVPHSKVWTATQTDVEDESGNLLSLPGGQTVEAIDVDPRSGQVWVAMSGSLLRFDHARNQELSVALTGLSFVSSDGRSGAWAASQSTLYRIAADGTVATSFSPANDPSVEAISADTSSSDVWEAGILDVHEFSATGATLLTESSLANVTALAVYSDVVPPSIAITSPADGSSSYADVPTVSLSYSDNVGVDTATLSAVGESGSPAWSCSGGVTTATCSPVSPLAAGSHTVTASIADSAGNVASATIHFTVLVDVTPPTITITSPQDGVPYGDRPTEVDVSYSDNVGVATATLSVSAGAGAPAFTCFPRATSGFCTSSGLSDGTHDGTWLVTAQVTDVNGNVGSASIHVVVDTTPPVITVTSPVEGSYTNQTRISVTGTVNEPIRGANINGTVATLSADHLSFSGSVALNAEGTNRITVGATDPANNFSQVFRNVIRDTVAPATVDPANVTIVYNADGSVGVSCPAGCAEAGATVTITDPSSGESVQVTVNADGSFSATTIATDALPGDQLQFAVTDSAGNRSSVTGRTVGGDFAPPNPAAVAPVIDPSTPTNFVSAYSFIWSGTHRLQSGVLPGTIPDDKAAVLRGQVADRSGNPIANVEVSVLNHPEYHFTKTRADGWFDLGVSGGGSLVVRFDKPGLFTVERSVSPAWQSFRTIPQVTMVAEDTTATPLDFGGAGTMQVAQSSPSTDADGTRTATVLVPAGTSAEMVFADGSTQPLLSGTLRVSEFTVGASGTSAMPAELPQNSAYTYAASFAFDEAIAAGALHVEFSQPVVSYTENFRGLPVGVRIPVGELTPASSTWSGQADGRVVEILSVTGGVADLDIDGNGTAATAAEYAALGVSDDERAELASLYTVGQSLWRVARNEFCNLDYNPHRAGTIPPNGGPAVANGTVPDPDRCQGSIIDCENQTLGEAVPITGTPFSLHYESNRTPGDVIDRQVSIPLSGSSIPSTVEWFEYRVQVAGQDHVFKQIAPAANDTVTFTWNGLDVYGRTMQGRTRAHITVAWHYQPTYNLAPCDDSTGQSFNSSTPPACEVVGLLPESVYFGFDQEVEWDVTVSNFDQRGLGLGGWSLSPQHVFDPAGNTLLLGDGRTILPTAAPSVIHRIAGDNFSGLGSGDDGTPAQYALIGPGRGHLGRLPTGGYVWGDSSRVRGIGADGLLHTYAGDGNCGWAGDGGPATQAEICGASSVSVGPDGSIFIADDQNHRVRKVDPNGIISTLAGNGVDNSTGDGGLATAAEVQPYSVTAAPDGSVYVVEYNSGHVRHIRNDGFIELVAGSSIFGAIQDEVPATQAPMQPTDVSVAADGTLLIADSAHVAIHRVTLDGIIHLAAGGAVPAEHPRCEGCDATTSGMTSPTAVYALPQGGFYESEAGNGNYDPAPANRVRIVTDEGKIYTVLGVPGGAGDQTAEGISALDASTGFPSSALLVDGAGRLLVAFPEDNHVYAVQTALPGFSDAGYQIPSEDGSQIYFFDASGRHLRTLDALTGAAVYTFGYSNGRLTTITDAFNNVTTIQRDGSGNPTAILAPGGQTTTLALTGQYLSSITDPAGEPVHLTYDGNGLLTDYRDARLQDHVISYDTSTGLLSRDSDPGGGSSSLSRSGGFTGYTVTKSSELGRTTTYALTALTDSSIQEQVTAPDGTVEARVRGTDKSQSGTQPDGTRVFYKPGRDPRFGLDAPIAEDVKLTTPGGLTLEATESRSATLSDPNNPLSLTAETDTVTVNGKSYASTFDAASRTITTTTPAGRQRVLTLDALGRVVQAQTGNLAPVAIAYDLQGRVQTVTQGSGGAQRQYQLAYDTSNRLQSVTDPLTHVVSFGYDAADRVNLQTLPDTKTVAATYDANSNLSTLTPPGEPAHAFGYTPVDLESSYTPPDVSGDGSRSTGYSYNVDRQLTQVSRPDALTVTPTYDAQKGRITSLAWSAGTETFSYDANNGKLTSVAAPGGVTTSFGYDGPLPTSESWSGAVAGSVTRAFDNNLRLTTEQVNGANAAAYGYDDDGLVTSVAAGGITESITRSADTGQITATSAGSVTTTRTYNAFGEPAEDQAKFGSTLLYDAVYDDGAASPRDQLSRIQKKTETIDGVTHSYVYSYDLRGRLTAVTIDGASSPARSWTYDDNGNRLTQTSGGTTTYYLYDGQDRLLCERASSGSDCVGATVSYIWTANGELAAKTDAVGTTSFQYDELGNLRHVDLPGGHTIDYLIDGANRRVGRKYDGALTNAWVYRNSLKPVAELDGSGNVVARFVYATKGQVPDLIVKGGVTYRVVSDHLGTPRIIVDQATGSVVERLDVDEWGNVVSDTNSGWQPFGFDGGLADAATALVRFGERDSDPRTGTWTAKDPIGLLGGLAVYSFAAADPVNAIDPYGLTVTVDPALQGVYDAAKADPILGSILQVWEDDPNIDYRIQAGPVPPYAGGPGPGGSTVAPRKLTTCPPGQNPYIGFRANTYIDPLLAGLGADAEPLDAVLAHEVFEIQLESDAGFPNPRPLQVHLDAYAEEQDYRARNSEPLRSTPYGY